MIDRGAWIICTEPSYEGDCLFSMPGYLRNMQNTAIGPHVGSLRNAGLVHDYRWAPKISLRIPSEGDYRHSLVLGGPNQERVVIALDLPDLATAGLTFPIVAVGVGDRRFGWQLCSEPNYAGHCIYMVDSITDFRAIFGWNVASARGRSSGATSSRDQRGVQFASFGK